MKVTVKALQTVADIAVAVYGDVRAVIDIARANNIKVTEDLEPGTVLECPEIVYDKQMQDYCREHNISPATALQSDGDIELRIFNQAFSKEFA